MRTKAILLLMLAALPVMAPLTGTALSKTRLSAAMSQIDHRNPSDAGTVIASVTTAVTHLDQAHVPFV